MTVDTIKNTEEWFKKAISEPTKKDFATQFSVFMEEFLEAVKEVDFRTDSPDLDFSLYAALGGVEAQLTFLINALRQGQATLEIKDRTLFLDGLCDTVVTAVASAHTAKMDLPGGLAEINRSNFSKFVDGSPIFIEGTRKIGKGPNYVKPQLEPFVK